jgi:predicted ABC-type ATPase
MRDLRSQLWVFAGPNGTGKSTLAAKHLRERLPIVNPDVIAVELRREQQHATEIEAGKIALLRRTKFLANRQSFAIETTMSGNSEMRLMRDAEASGYKVNLVFVGVDLPETSVARVAHRVRLGLHYVAPDDILRRYQRSMDNLSIAMQIAARTLIVDNTGKGFRLLYVRDQGRKATIAKRLPAWMRNAVPEELR